MLLDIHSVNYDWLQELVLDSQLLSIVSLINLEIVVIF